MAARPVTWQNNRLVAQCGPEDRARLGGVLQTKSFAAGAMIFAEGARADEFYLLCQGSVEVLHNEAGELYRIATLAAGDYFGEMGLLDDTVRSASVRALEDVLVQTCTRADFRALVQGPDGERLESRLLRGHAHEQNHRLRRTSDLMSDSLYREVQRMRELVRLSLMLITVVLVLWAYSALVVELNALPELRRATSLALSLGAAGGAAYYIRTSPYPRQAFGLTLAGWRPALRYHLTWTVVFLAVCTLLKWVMVSTIPALAHHPVLEVRFLGYTSPLLSLALMIAVYLLVSLLQEFTSRAMLQTSFALLLRGPRASMWAIGLSNALYSTFHMHYSFGVAVATFVLGIFFGTLWSRHPSLLAVSLAHFLAGFWAIEFLGALTLLGMKV
jgi:CRP-like cAMP-binding protein